MKIASAAARFALIISALSIGLTVEAQEYDFQPIGQFCASGLVGTVVSDPANEFSVFDFPPSHPRYDDTWAEDTGRTSPVCQIIVNYFGGNGGGFVVIGPLLVETDTTFVLSHAIQWGVTRHAESCCDSEGNSWSSDHIWYTSPASSREFDPVQVFADTTRLWDASEIEPREGGADWERANLTDRVPNTPFWFVYWNPDPDDQDASADFNYERIRAYQLAYDRAFPVDSEGHIDIARPWAVSPNPARGHAQIEGFQIITDRWELYDALGRRVDNGTTDHVSVHGLPSGLYVVRLTRRDTVVSIPITVLR